MWFQQVTIQPPKYRTKEALVPVTVWAVWAVEEHPPAGAAALEWLLLTTVAVWLLRLLLWRCPHLETASTPLARPASTGTF